MFFQKIINLAILVLMVDLACAEPNCTALELSKEQVVDIVNAERRSRGDLPKAFSESQYTLNRHGCYYILIESAVPLRPGKNIVFKLNQNGVIVDAMRGR
ncbi:hypothetical protein ACQE3E_01600 [Methylomonas sp. MED-D]|uniref:hypothetical protein n=1 Tax=unclassified Methylomonas TaxID=2608980 RepID=UPI0008D92345|nr:MULTISPECIES: hypothetical protein [unclassified Methylomonas]MDT4330395.1 hypothetical protein [Methylomonas sp. MV1]OHX35025.1 hypothetical protein BJL95_04180 [Methylomonas sp. LWB]